MTLFRNIPFTCRFTEDWGSCARCWVKDKRIYDECHKEMKYMMNSQNFLVLMKELDPNPYSDIEFKAQDVDRWNYTNNFSSFVKRWFEAYNTLWLFPRELKEKAALIIQSEIKNGATPCQAMITAWEQLQ